MTIGHRDRRLAGAVLSTIGAGSSVMRAAKDPPPGSAPQPAREAGPREFPVKRDAPRNSRRSASSSRRLSTEALMRKLLFAFVAVPLTTGCSAGLCGAALHPRRTIDE